MAGWRGSVTEAIHHVQTRIADLLTPADQPPACGPMRRSGALRVLGFLDVALG